MSERKYQHMLIEGNDISGVLNQLDSVVKDGFEIVSCYAVALPARRPALEPLDFDPGSLPPVVTHYYLMRRLRPVTTN